MATISTLAVNLIARTSVFEKNINKSIQSLKRFQDTTRSTTFTMRNFVAGMSSVRNVASRMISSAVRLSKLVSLALVGIGTASVKLASDVQENENLFQISMGNMAESANKWSESYSKSLGLFTNDTKKAVGTFQLMLTSMGLTESEAFKMSKGLTQLSNDIASFRNQKPEDVFLKLQSGITGESEPLKRLGILVNDTIIKQMAMTDATIQSRIAAEKVVPKLEKYGNLIVDINKSASKQTLVLTETEKVMLRYKAIVNATKNDQGDMARTLNDTANVFRVIWAQVKTTGAAIGEELLPVVTKVAIAFRDFLVSNQPMFKMWGEKAASAISSVVDKLALYFNLIKAGNFEAVFKDLSKIFSNILDGIVGSVEKLTPIAVDLGQAIFDGFWKGIQGTKLAKFLNATVEVATNIAAPDTYLRALESSRVAGIAGSNLNKSIGTIGERASGQATFSDEERRSIIDELKGLRREVSTGGSW